MKENKNEKFSFEKFEIAKLKKASISGGTGVGGDPDTGTDTSDKCSIKPGCRRPLDPNPFPSPNDPPPPPGTN